MLFGRVAVHWYSYHEVNKKVPMEVKEAIIRLKKHSELTWEISQNIGIGQYNSLDFA